MKARIGDLIKAIKAGGIACKTDVSPDIELSGPVDWSAFDGEGLAFYTYEDPEPLRQWNNETRCLIICSDKMRKILHHGPFIYTNRPKSAFVLAARLFVPKERPETDHTALVHPDAKIGMNASIGPFAVIGAANIGDDAIIGSHVSISDHVVMGNNVRVMNGAHLGADGLGSLPNGLGQMMLFPHFKDIEIGSNTVFGPGTVVFRGVLKPTVIKGNTHLSANCTIGHNAMIGHSVFCAPGSHVAGSAVVGDKCLLGQGCSIKEGVIIAERTTIGMNVSIFRDVKTPGMTFIAPAGKCVGNMFSCSLVK